MNTKVVINLNDVNKVSKFVNAMGSFESDIDIISKHYICDGKSLLGILSFDLSKPVTVEIISDDKEEIERFNKVLEEFR